MWVVCGLVCGGLDVESQMDDVAEGGLQRVRTIETLASLHVWGTQRVRRVRGSRLEVQTVSPNNTAISPLHSTLATMADCPR